jgi:hypothetical protein
VEYLPFLRPERSIGLHTKGNVTAAIPSACRAIEIEWRYITNLHLPLRAALDFRSREELLEQVWTYSFKDNTGKVLTRTGTQSQIDEDVQGVGSSGGVM